MSRTSDRFVDRGQLREPAYRGAPQRHEKRSRSPSPYANDGGIGHGHSKARRNVSPPPNTDNRSSRRDSRRGSPRNSDDNKLKRRRSPTPEPRHRGSGNSSNRQERGKPRRSRSRSYSPGENVASPDLRQQLLSHGSNAILDEHEEEERMRRLMGFSSFDSSKGKQHADVGEAQIAVRRRYRQYMNRKGGFNRPLDPIK